MNPILQVTGLTKSYGERIALDGVSFTADAGERVAIIGPNGAGKTTLLSILAGITSASGGEVTLPAGEVGWVPQQPAVYSKLTVAENLRLFARLEKSPEVDRVVSRMLELTDLADRSEEQLGRLSGGNRQRVNIAIGLLANPAVLLLDEPSSSLDPRQRERLWQFIDSLARDGTSVVFSTHNVSETERHSDRVLVLADGELLFSGSAEQLLVASTHSAPGVDFEGAFVAFLKERSH